MSAHQVALFHADAMFAAEDAAHRDAEPQDFGAERFRPLQLARLHHIINDERMQIAVAGVKDIAAACRP